MSTPPDILVRPATAADLPEVVTLIRALAEFEKLPVPDDAGVARLAADFAAARFELMVAARSERLIAYALYFHTYSSFRCRPSLYLEDLFVHPDARGLGVGAAMLSRLASLAVERGCGRFEWVVLDWNVKAQEFYRSLGARLLPEWQLCRVDDDGLTRLAARARSDRE